ncbi:MAG TPA: hypothetical protein VI337_06110 [Nitrospirales bacterium]|nr:hypothetical protein [Nitrospirales bacterium]
MLIRADPTKDHRAVEAVRIALGLGSHNEGQDLTLVLCNRAPLLLCEDNSEIVDAETLERYLPVFIEWGTPFGIAADAVIPSRYLPDCVTKPMTMTDIAASLKTAERVLVF